MNPKVDFYFDKENKWSNAIVLLRKTILECGLSEELKWGCPCYTLGGRNIALIHVFKEYCAVLFFKGALLQDEKKLLIQQSSNVQAARQLRFTDHHQVAIMKKVIQAYVYEAIEVEKAGLKVPMKNTNAYEVPAEFENKLKELPALKSAFDALTPGRQRGYLLHFGAPKLEQTRVSRIEKSIPQILAGKGLNDR